MPWWKRTLIGALFGMVLFALAAWFAAPDRRITTLAGAAVMGLFIGGFIGLTDWVR